MSDDEWETDPDYINDLTDEQTRAFGNRENMEKYNAVMNRRDSGSAIGVSRISVSAPTTTKSASTSLDEKEAAAAGAGAESAGLNVRNGESQRATMAQMSSRAQIACQTQAQIPSQMQARSPPRNQSQNELPFSNQSFEQDHSRTEAERARATAAAALHGYARSSDDLHAKRSTGSSATSKQSKAVFQVQREQIVHSFDEAECEAFRDFINTKLATDESLSYLLPLAEMSELFSCVSDGVLLCKLINVAVADTVDERAINMQPRHTFAMLENLNLALNAAKSIGLTVVNIGPQDLIEMRPHLVLGLVWQMVKVSLLSGINLKSSPFLVKLLQPGEEVETLLKLPPEKILMRWVNYHLEQAGHPERIANFGADLRDSSVYCHLLSQIDPAHLATTSILKTEQDTTRRAQYVVEHARRLGSEFQIAPAHIVGGNEKLNMAFVASLFNASPGVELVAEEGVDVVEEVVEEGAELREERALRMWLNSLGLGENCYVRNLFDDVADGLAILLAMDRVSAGSVDWSRVNRDCRGVVFKKTENLNYVVELGKSSVFSFSLVGVQGNDIVVGNRKLTLALIWQLFRFHLLSFLSSVRDSSSKRCEMSDEQIVAWANEKVAASGSSERIRDLHDKRISSGLFLIDLLAALEPRSINRALVAPGVTESDKQLNAKYAISVARKLGCSLFLLWEDVVEVRPRMVLSFLASAMALQPRDA